MNRLASLLVLLPALSCGAARPQTSFDGTAALGYAQQQMAFGPRIPNTPGHRHTGDWLLQMLRERADTVEVQEWVHVTTSGDSLHLRNFIARFRPDRTDRVAYLAHWDTRTHADQSPNMGDRRLPVPGANDGASGVALLLGVADVLHREPPRVGVDLVFVDGEDYGEWDAERHDVLLGSTRYAASLDKAHFPLYAVVWDMIGDRDLRIPKEPYSVQGAPEVVERVWRVARELGYGRVFVDELGTGLTDDHTPLLARGIHAIDVIDFTYPPWHTTEDTLDKLSAASLQTVGDVAVTLVK